MKKEKTQGKIHRAVSQSYWKGWDPDYELRTDIRDEADGKGWV